MSDVGRMSTGERLACAGLFGLAFAIRCLAFTSVFVEGRVRFVSFDAYYHLRRVRYALGGATTPLEIDPYVAFPAGGKPIWPPLFDSALAFAARILAPADQPAAVERALVWVPPLLGALTVAFVFWWGRRLFGVRVGGLAALLLSVLPAHVFYARLSFVDHHVAVALFSTLLLAAAVSALQRRPDATPEAATALGLGGLLGLCVLVWPGAILHAALVEVAMLAALPACRSGGDAAALARTMALANAIALALVLPFCVANAWPQWSAYSPVVLSRFQPWFFGVLTIQFLACHVLWRGAGRSIDPLMRLGQAVAVGLLLLATSFATADLGAGLIDAWEWAAREEVFQRKVAESEPLLQLGRRFTTAVAVEHFSGLFFVFPLAWIGFVRAMWSSTPAAPGLLLAMWSLVFALATLSQRRFENTASIAFCLVCAWAIVAGCEWLAARARGGALRAAAPVAVGAALLLALWPSLSSYGPDVADALRVAQGRRVAITSARDFSGLQIELAEWIRTHTPATAGLYDASVRPEYGIHAPWGMGHLLKYVAERPTLLGNFGDDVGRDPYLAATQVESLEVPEAVARLDALRARYLVLRRGRARGPLPASLFDDAPQRQTGFRLLYESEPRRHYPQPVYKVFERVAAARVIGRARPGSIVRAELAFRTGRGARAFATSATTDAHGRYRLTLPYSTRGSPDSIRPAQGYVVTSDDGAHAMLAIDEAEVVRGLEVPGPTLGPPGEVRGAYPERSSGV